MYVNVRKFWYFKHNWHLFFRFFSNNFQMVAWILYHCVKDVIVWVDESRDFSTQCFRQTDQEKGQIIVCIFQENETGKSVLCL